MVLVWPEFPPGFHLSRYRKPDPIPEHKKCSKCLIKKDISEFPFGMKRGKYYFRAQCKGCLALDAKRRMKNKLKDNGK